MSLPCEKISSILPRLASEHDGEIVASVRAIGRLLRASGADWHDFVATFERGAVAAPHKEKRAPASDGPPTWRTAAIYERAALLALLTDVNWLSPWERSFVETLAATYPGRPISAKQAAIIDRLLDRLFAEGGL